MMNENSSQSGISLVELLVSIIILSIVVAALLPVASSGMRMSASSERLSKQFLLGYYLTDVGKANAISSGGSITSQTIQTPYGPFNINYSTNANLVNIETKWLTEEEYLTAVIPPITNINVLGVHVKILSPQSGDTVSGTFTLVAEAYGYVNGTKLSVDNISASSAGSPCTLTGQSDYTYTFTCTATTGPFTAEVIGTYGGIQGIDRIQLMGQSAGTLVVDIVNPPAGGYVYPVTFSAAVKAYLDPSGTPASSVSLTANGSNCNLTGQSGSTFTFSCPSPTTDGATVELVAQASLGSLSGSDSETVYVRNRIEIAILSPNPAVCLPPGTSTDALVSSEHLYGPDSSPLMPDYVMLGGQACTFQSQTGAQWTYSCPIPSTAGSTVTLEVQSSTDSLNGTSSVDYQICCQGNQAVNLVITKRANGQILTYVTPSIPFSAYTYIELSQTSPLIPDEDKFCGLPVHDTLLPNAVANIPPFARIQEVLITRKNSRRYQTITTVCNVEEDITYGNNQPDIIPNTECQIVPESGDVSYLTTATVSNFPIFTKYCLAGTCSSVLTIGRNFKFQLSYNNNYPLVADVINNKIPGIYYFGTSNDLCPFCNTVPEDPSLTCQEISNCRKWYRSIKYDFDRIIYQLIYQYLAINDAYQISNSYNIQLSDTCKATITMNIKVDWSGYIEKIPNTAYNIAIYFQSTGGDITSATLSFNPTQTDGTLTTSVTIPSIESSSGLNVWFEYYTRDPQATVTVTITGTITYLP